MNILEAEVRQGVARVGVLEFPVAGVPDGSCVQIGFRPYTVKLSNDLSCYQLRGVVKHVYFLGGGLSRGDPERGWGGAAFPSQ